jgi:hypothetical protein
LGDVGSVSDNLFVLIYPHTERAYYLAHVGDICQNIPIQIEEGVWFTEVLLSLPDSAYDIVLVGTEPGTSSDNFFFNYMQTQCDRQVEQSFAPNATDGRLSLPTGGLYEISTHTIHTR